MSDRLVLVDDTNTNINYDGPWFTAQNTQLNTGTNGPPYQNTLHGVKANASFSYFFSGSQVIVLGTSITTNASGTQDPTWKCFIDNISIGWDISAGPEAENSWVFCQSNLIDGPHELNVNVTVMHQQFFWLDQIQYRPSSNVSLDNSTVRVGASDPAVRYSSGWTELDGIVNLTQSTGSTVTFQFFGVSLSWLGFVPPNFSLNSTSAIYSIDGQTPIPFFVPALSAANALPLYNQVFFKTETLSPGQHELIVTYQGNSGTAPLALDSFVVQNASASRVQNASTTSTLTSVSSATSATSSSVPSSSPSHSTSTTLGSRKLPLVAIITGVVGGAIVLVLLLLLCIARRNNRRAQISKANLDTKPEPFNLYNSEIPPLAPQCFSNKLTRKRASSKNPGRSRPTPLPEIWAQIDSINSAIHNTETISLMQVSTKAQVDDLEVLQHADSGVRMPLAQGNLVELPPIYTSG